MTGEHTKAPGHGPFAIWNRSGNRPIAMLLRSPLHGAVSGRLTLITVTGRRTGREHTLPVGYSQQGTVITVPVMWPERKLWWRNLRDGASVRLRLRGNDVTGWGHAKVEQSGKTVVEIQLEPAPPAVT
jgi:hypothetical protein